MIEIQNIQTNSLADLVALLAENTEQSVEIYVPKSSVDSFSSNEDIATDYAMLAFAGQKLYEIADEFSYDYVSPHEHASVRFKLVTDDIKRLAEVLLYISYGYNNEPTEEEVYYLDEVLDFVDKVDNGTISPVCHDFVDDYHSYKEDV